MSGSSGHWLSGFAAGVPEFNSFAAGSDDTGAEVSAVSSFSTLRGA
jgi:hypothetical protein